MKSNLTSLIVSRMSDFSKGQKRIAQYIMEHYDEAAFMTAFRLGETVGVSESTVVRFAAELGFDGYPELQKAVQELVRSKLNSIQRIEVTRARMMDDEVLDNILSYDMANIRQTLDELPREVFYDAVDAVIHARKIYIFGAGSCRSLANFTAYYLKMLLGDIHLVYTSSEMEILEEMFSISEDDVLIGLSFPRYSSKAVKAVHFAKSRNAKVVAITDRTVVLETSEDRVRVEFLKSAIGTVGTLEEQEAAAQRKPKAKKEEKVEEPAIEEPKAADEE